MKILTLARKCGNHAVLFACFKLGAVPNCYRYLEIVETRMMRSGFDFTTDLHNLSGYPTKELKLGPQLKRKEISFLCRRKPDPLGLRLGESGQR